MAAKYTNTPTLLANSPTEAVSTAQPGTGSKVNGFHINSGKKELMCSKQVEIIFAYLCQGPQNKDPKQPRLLCN